MSSTARMLQSLFLDYTNNYLTKEKFAEHNGLTIEEAVKLIDLGFEIHERLVEEWKETRQEPFKVLGIDLTDSIL